MAVWEAVKADQGSPAGSCNPADTRQVHRVRRGYMPESGRVALWSSGEELLGNELVRRAYLGLSRPLSARPVRVGRDPVAGDVDPAADPDAVVLGDVIEKARE